MELYAIGTTVEVSGFNGLRGIVRGYGTLTEAAANNPLRVRTVPAYLVELEAGGRGYLESGPYVRILACTCDNVAQVTP